MEHLAILGPTAHLSQGPYSQLPFSAEWGLVPPGVKSHRKRYLLERAAGKFAFKPDSSSFAVAPAPRRLQYAGIGSASE